MVKAEWPDSPWTLGGLTLLRAVVDRVDGDVIARYATDEEACGYLRGPLDAPLLCDEAVPLDNQANKLHRLDRETYFRTARTFFAFNEKKLDDAVTRSREEARPVKVLYHSHLDAAATFSDTDAAVMSFGVPPSTEGGAMSLGPGPQWPLAFLVVSVGRRAGQGEVTGLERRLHVWSGAGFVDADFSISGRSR